MHLRFLPLFFLASLLPADTLSDLKGTLARLNGQEPVKASVDYQFWSRQGDEKKPVVTEGKATTLVEEGPQGLKLSWSRGILQAAAQEAKAQAMDPEKSTPIRRAIEAMKAVEVSDYLNGAEDLLRTLEQSQLLEEKAEAWQGKPARLLQLKFSPRMGQQQRRYIKEMNATVKVWVGVDGLPLAAVSQVNMKGRALLVVSFEQQQKEEFHFARAGNRLLVVHHAKENNGSGGGEKGQSKSVMNLNLN
jgi:hypothetical protein